MRSALRNTVVGVALATTTFVGTTPAHAFTYAHVQGLVTIGCFGCGTFGPAGNDADFWVNGVVDNSVAGPALFGVTPPNGGAVFTVVDSTTYPECLISSTAAGTVTVTTSAGGKSAGFVWTRTFNSLVVSIPAWGAIGTFSFTIIAPVGVPCGGPVTAYVEGDLVGTA